MLKKTTALNILRMTPTGSNVYRTNYNTIHTTPSGSHPFFVNQFSINMLSLRDKTITVQFHNVVGGFSPPFERSGGVAGTELEGRA